MRALVLALAVASCSPFIAGTRVREPAKEHQGWLKEGCFSPTAGREPDHACCWFRGTRHTQLLVCSKDGGSTWDEISRIYW